MKDPTQPGSLAGRYEIAQIFDVSRQGTQSIVDHPDFPAPICFIGKNKTPLFWARDVEAFKAERKRAAAQLAA